MPLESGDGTGPGSDATQFPHALDGLEQRGGALLVVGTVPNEQYERVSQHLLGDERPAAPRRRLVVADDSTAKERLARTGPTTPEYARAVVREGVPESVRGQPTAADRQPEPTGGARVHHVGPSLDELGLTLTDIIDQFTAAADGLSAAELRVAFDCLPELLAQYGEETTFRFLHVLTNQIRARGGIAHFHLPEPIADRSIRALEPLFDAVIELRVRDDELQQRWHVLGEAVVPEWSAVDGPR